MNETFLLFFVDIAVFGIPPLQIHFSAIPDCYIKHLWLLLVHGPHPIQKSRHSKQYITEPNYLYTEHEELT